MTTAHSPIAKLRAQADKMATILKAAERGDKLPAVAHVEKLIAARQKESVKFVVAMDDKLLTIEMPWVTIRETTEHGISEYIVKRMREARDAVN